MKTDYYVYTYSCPYSGNVKYVGMGRDRRSENIYGRRADIKKWLDELRERGKLPTVAIVVGGLSQEEAFKQEIALIAKYGRQCGAKSEDQRNKAGKAFGVLDARGGGEGKSMTMRHKIPHPGKTQAQRKALDIIGCGGFSPPMSRQTRDALLSAGLIVQQDRVVSFKDGLPPIKIPEFYMPIDVHIQWCDHHSENENNPTPTQTRQIDAEN